MGDAGALTYRLLGPLEVVGEEGAVDVGPTKQRAILAILLLRRGHVVPTDALVDLLWDGAPPATAVATLHGYIAGLRRAIGPGVVVTRSPGYLVEVPDTAVDAARFTRLHATGRAALDDGRPAEAASALRTALDLWRGPALGDLASEPFARAEATALDEARVAALDAWARAELERGRHAEVVGELERAVAEAPLREDLRARLMVALYRTGRQAEALRTFATGRAVLADEVGIDPGPELVALEAAILAQDPALAWSPDIAPDPAPQAPTATPVATPDLVGRDDERALLLADLDSTLDGSGRVALIGGEPGIGKTRLAQEVARVAADRGATVVWGRAHEGRGAPALWPWTQVLDALVERSDPEAVAAAMGPTGAAMAAFSGAVAAAAGDAALLPPLDTEGNRFRAFDATARFVCALARSRPVVVVLDDVQWADVASLGLLGHLAAAVGDAPVLVACTFRTVAPGVGGDLAGLLADLARLPQVRRIGLEGLARADVGRLLETAPGGRILDVDAVIERTRGNPFFLGELVRWAGGAGGAGGAGRVPSAVGDVVRARVRRLPEATASALADAAILGTDLEADVLAAVLGLDPADLLDVLSPALEAGLLAPAGIGGRWRYSHGLVSETLSDDLDPARRTRLHRRAAAALTAQHGDADGPHLVAVADHLVQAIPAVPRTEAVDAAVRASAWAQAHLAHEQAEDQLRTALALIEDVPAGPERDGRELAVQDHLSRLLITTLGYASPALREAAARMAELSERLAPDHELLVPALWRLANLHTVRMQLDAGVAFGQRLLGVAEAGDDPGVLLVAHSALGTVHTHRGDVTVGRTHLDAALAIVHGGADVEVLSVVPESGPIWALVFSAWNHWSSGDDVAEDEITEALDRGLGYGRRSYPHVFALWFAGLVSALRGDAERSVARCDEGIEAALASGFGMVAPFMAANRAWALSQLGEPGVGLAEVEGATLAVGASGARMLAPMFHGYIADIHLRAEHPAEAEASARRGLHAVDVTGEHWFDVELRRLLAGALVAQGDADGAEVALRTAAAVAASQGRAAGPNGISAPPLPT